VCVPQEYLPEFLFIPCTLTDHRARDGALLHTTTKTLAVRAGSGVLDGCRLSVGAEIRVPHS
jgi:hypothetical protein